MVISGVKMLLLVSYIAESMSFHKASSVRTLKCTRDDDWWLNSYKIIGRFIYIYIVDKSSKPSQNTELELLLFKCPLKSLKYRLIRQLASISYIHTAYFTQHAAVCIYSKESCSKWHIRMNASLDRTSGLDKDSDQ